MKKKLSFFLAFLMILSMAGCTAGQPEEPPHVSKSNFMLDTYIEITLYDWTDASTIDLAFDEIRRLESLLSVEQTGSDLDRLAKAAGEGWRFPPKQKRSSACQKNTQPFQRDTLM